MSAPEVGATYVVTVERPVAGGRMLARHDGHVLFVTGAVPGEVVRARMTHRAGGALFAVVDDVIEPSTDRVVPASDPACGGMTYAHVRYERQLTLKAEILSDAFRHTARQPLEQPPLVRASPRQGYRLRAHLHVRGLDAGFYREGTRELCAAGPTGQLTAEATASVDAVVRTLAAHHVSCRSVMLAENVAASQRVVHLDLAPGAKLATAAAPLRAITGLTGLTMSGAKGAVTVSGAPVVEDAAADLFSADALPCDASARWRRHATSFFQGNRFLLGPLVSAVLDAASGTRVVDLYAGVGLFAVALASRGASVVAVEGDRSSGDDLAANARPWRDRLLVVRSAVERAVATRPRETPDAVVLDPPRTGVSAAALKGLAAWRVPRVVYVSCDPPTLARDAARLRDAGYRLTSLEAFDLFPDTPHVEALAVFTHAG